MTLPLQLIMYPKASGRGIKASNLMKALCQLAGIQDVGIKIQVPDCSRAQCDMARAEFDIYRLANGWAPSMHMFRPRA